VGKHSQELT
jgi:MFS family permease